MGKTPMANRHLPLHARVALESTGRTQLAGAHAALHVERAGHRVPGELRRWDVRQERRRVDVHGVAA